jgi:hypothetical protein
MQEYPYQRFERELSGLDHNTNLVLSAQVVMQCYRVWHDKYCVHYTIQPCSAYSTTALHVVQHEQLPDNQLNTGHSNPGLTGQQLVAVSAW